MGLGEAARAFDVAGTRHARSGKTKPIPERLVPVKDIRKRILLVKTMRWHNCGNGMSMAS